MKEANIEHTIFEDNEGHEVYWEDLNKLSVLDIEERGIHVAEN